MNNVQLRLFSTNRPSKILTAISVIMLSLILSCTTGSCFAANTATTSTSSSNASFFSDTTAVVATATVGILTLGAIIAGLLNSNNNDSPSSDVKDDDDGYYLSNGLKVIVKEDHRASVAILQIWYKVGSCYELKGQTGISHALEHMMFRGTKKYGEGVLDKIITKSGGNLNAFTSNDFTAYYEALPVDKLPIAFALEADRMQGILLDKAAFDKEKQVVIEERKMSTEDNPNSYTWERFCIKAYGSSPYSNPVIGWMNDINNLTTEDLRMWHKSWYAPNNAILVVVGDVKESEIRILAQQYFGKIPRSDIPSLKPQKTAEIMGKREIIVKRPAQVPFLIMGYNTPNLKTVDQKWCAYALEVLCGILTSGASARLEKNLVRGQQVAASVSASYDLYSLLDGLFVVTGTPSQGHTVKELEAAVLEQIELLQNELVSTQELDRIKAQVVAKKVYARDSIYSQAYEIGSLEVVGLSYKESDKYVENIKAITPKQVQLAARYLIPARSTTAELQPIKS